MLKLPFLLFFLLLSCSGKNDSKTAGSITEQVKETNKPKIVVNQERKAKFNKNLTPEIIGEIDHRYDSYTQGLVFNEGALIESTGEYTRSKIFKLDPENGKIINEKKLPMMFFGEGATVLDSKIYILTWKAGVCLIYDKSTFNEIGRFDYQGEGWGITNDENVIYMSNGSNQIILRDRDSFFELGRISIFDENGIPYNYLNELEFINGEIWANVWMQDVILRIDPKGGKIIQKIDLSFLKSKLENNPQAEVLNGIAYDDKEEIFYLTGKNWNKIFKIKFN